MPRIPTPEGGNLKACLDILAGNRIWHERRNTGGMRIGKRYVKFSRKGTADIYALPQVLVELICDRPQARGSAGLAARARSYQIGRRTLSAGGILCSEQLKNCSDSFGRPLWPATGAAQS